MAAKILVLLYSREIEKVERALNGLRVVKYSKLILAAAAGG